MTSGSSVKFAIRGNDRLSSSITNRPESLNSRVTTIQASEYSLGFYSSETFSEFSDVQVRLRGERSRHVHATLRFGTAIARHSAGEP